VNVSTGTVADARREELLELGREAAQDRFGRDLPRILTRLDRLGDPRRVEIDRRVAYRHVPGEAQAPNRRPQIRISPARAGRPGW